MTHNRQEGIVDRIRESVDLDRDPEFVADHAKAVFVGDICEAMHQMKINRAELSEMLGLSRQYLGRILNETANFTIETMAKISCALGRQLSIRMVVPKSQLLASYSRLDEHYEKLEEVKTPGEIVYILQARRAFDKGGNFPSDTSRLRTPIPEEQYASHTAA